MSKGIIWKPLDRFFYLTFSRFKSWFHMTFKFQDDCKRWWSWSMMVMMMINKSVMFLLFLLSLGNIAISGLWESLLEFTLFRNTKKETWKFFFLFYFDLFKVDLSPYFQLHKNFHQLVVLSIWFSKPFSSNLFSYQAIVRQLACLRKF